MPQGRLELGVTELETGIEKLLRKHSSAGEKHLFGHLAEGRGLAGSVDQPAARAELTPGYRARPHIS